MRFRWTSSLVLLVVLAGCRPAPDLTAAAKPAQPVWFEDVTSKLGLNFILDAGPTNSYFMPQSAGSGAALFDFDNDGRLDIYLLQNAGAESGKRNQLFHQEPDGRFRDVSAGSGLDVAGFGMGVAVGDINNDGWPDVLVTEYGRVRLFLNDGHGHFTGITAEAGITNLLWGTSAAFFDYDRDGWLDLVLVNYVSYDPARWCADADSRQEFCGPSAFNGTVTKLFHNLGGKSGSVRFQDVTLDSGLGRTPGPGLGVFCADFDGDRWPDIFITNDGKPNHLWVNQHNGTFKEEAVQRGLAFNCLGRAEANMGIAIGDVEGDGPFDLFVTHLNSEFNTLWTQGPRGFFQDRTAACNLTGPKWRGTGFGTVLADFDHDGALDLAIANGRVKRGPPVADTSLAEFWRPYAERNQLFANDGHGKFRDISEANAAFCARAAVSRGLAVGDIDNDGALDLLVTSVAGPARLYRNIAPRSERGHWLMIRALDPALHRDAYGAEITVEAGGRRQMRWINPAFSYLCSNDPRAHFGLGAAGRVDAINVVWPDGSEENFPGTPADRLIMLHKGEGHAASR